MLKKLRSPALELARMKHGTKNIESLLASLYVSKRLTAKEICEQLGGISTRTLYSWLNFYGIKKRGYFRKN